MDDVIDRYDQAWNASDVEERRRLLEAPYGTAQVPDASTPPWGVPCVY